MENTLQALLSSRRPLADTMANIPMTIAIACAARVNWPNTQVPQNVLFGIMKRYIYKISILISVHLTPPPLCLLSISGCYGYIILGHNQRYPADYITL